jgi:hypothetical protein
MRVKLIQGDKVVESADCIEMLDFSVLTRRKDWKVRVDFGDGDETIAMVNWAEGTGYVVDTRGEDARGYLNLHSHIVPTVRCRLIRLFQQQALPGRMVTITPVLA